MTTSAQAHCAALVRTADRDRYVSTLFAPLDRRAALFALHAFNVEVSRVRDVVREALPGEIRLQWWRDAIAARQPTGNPVCDELLGAIERHELPTDAFDRILDGRIADLYNDPMPDRVSFEAWCGEVMSAPLQLSAMILDRNAAASVATAAGHAGCALGTVWVLQRLPVHRARGQCWIPGDILAAVGVGPEELIDGAPAAAAAIPAMVALGREHLAAFERAVRAVPAPLGAAFLPLAPVDAALRLLGRSPDPLRNPALPSDLRRQWHIWLRAVSGWRR